CAIGFLFDGFRRTIPQAQAVLEAGVAIDLVFEIDVAEEEIVKRLSVRRVHPGSGRVYHVVHNPPEAADKDDAAGEDLVQREDEKEDTVRTRLAIYHDQTAPLVSFYKMLQAEKGASAPQYVHVAGVGSLQEITDRVMKALA